MDKILSTRIDESVVHAIDVLAKSLHTSKKSVIETAVRLYAQNIDKNKNIDIFKMTSGAWHRKETAAELVKKSKKVFQQSMSRHQV